MAIGLAFPDLADRVRMQESGGGRPLVSGAGALGSMQLMPATADEMLARLGLHDILALPDGQRRERIRTDRALNDRLGEAYLQMQLDKFGSPELALAAYNAGPGNVRKWLRTYGDPRQSGDMAGFISQIPFAETRNYVDKIMGGIGGGKTPRATSGASGRAAPLPIDQTRNSAPSNLVDRAMSGAIGLARSTPAPGTWFDDNRQQVADSGPGFVYRGIGLG